MSQPYTSPDPQQQQPAAYGQPYPPQPAGYPAPGYVQPANNSMAVVSLISGIVGLFIIPLIGSIVAVITGHMAKKQIAMTREGGDGMATAGLIMGYIGLVLWGLAVIIAVFAWGTLLAAFGAAEYAS